VAWKAYGLRDLNGKRRTGGEGNRFLHGNHIMNGKGGSFYLRQVWLQGVSLNMAMLSIVSCRVVEDRF
jgi:hypothetical protein